MTGLVSTVAVVAQAVSDQPVSEETTFQWVLVLACWGAVLASLAYLLLRTVQRGRRLSRQVPEEQRRWM